MKRITLLFSLMMVITVGVSAQLRKNGMPDMRYSANKATYGSTYTTPTYTTPTYTTPSISYPTNPSSTYTSGYTRNDGTTVQGYNHTTPNSTNWDNYSTQGNTNPYTGTTGTRARDYSNDAYNYGDGKTIQTGPNGGQYYINSNGNKTYVPKRGY
jgi:hypothetical protein